MNDARKDYLVKEIWEDGSETYYITREHQREDAIHRVKVRWDSMAHVYAQHGTTIIRPVRYEHANIDDKKMYWHPASSISSLVKKVYLLDEMEHYYEYA
jgi:hypothetical protein